MELNIKIQGMHCQNCVKAVTKALTGLGAQAEVNLKAGEAKAVFSEKVAEEKVRDAIEDLGFDVVSISAN